MSTQAPGQGCYELRIAEHLGARWTAWFGGMDLVREDQGGTTLRGCVADQAELHGVLARVRDLGLTLLSVEATDVALARPAAAVEEHLGGRPELDRTSDTERNPDDHSDRT